MKKTIVLILLWLSGNSCLSKQQTSISCEESIVRAQEHINSYYSTDESTYLDSALVYLERPSNDCGEYKLSLELNRTMAYFLKNEFGKAIDAYRAIDTDMFSFPEHKYIIINQIKAKEAITKGKDSIATKYYQDIINNMNLYLDRNTVVRDSILRLSDHTFLTPTELEIESIFKSSYYYKSKTNNIRLINKELDSLRAKINGDYLYFESLKKSIAGIDGYHMSIPFE